MSWHLGVLGVPLDLLLGEVLKQFDQVGAISQVLRQVLDLGAVTATFQPVIQPVGEGGDLRTKNNGKMKKLPLKAAKHLGKTFFIALPPWF